MWLSHRISLKVTDLSIKMRMTSFTHYRTALSPINTGGLRSASTKPSRGSTLHTSETNYTLTGRWHPNTERSSLQSKAFVRSERTGCQSNLKKKRGKGKRDKRESMHRNSSVQLSFSDVSFSALSSWTQDASSGNSQGRREDGSAMTRDCRVEHQETAHLAPPLRTCPTAPISQCIGEIINNNKNKHARVLTMH